MSGREVGWTGVDRERVRNQMRLVRNTQAHCQWSTHYLSPTVPFPKPLCANVHYQPLASLSSNTSFIMTPPPHNKFHPWGFLSVTYLLKHFSPPCFDCTVLRLHCQEHNSALLRAVFPKLQLSLRKPTWHLPLSVLSDCTFFFWIGRCYFSPDESIMHGLYSQCSLSGFE